MSVTRTVITITHEMGSGGHAIAQQLAHNLKLTYVDKEIIKLATRHLGIPEEELANFDEKVLPRVKDLKELVTQPIDIPLSSVLVPERGPYGMIKEPALTGTGTGKARIISEDEKRESMRDGFHYLVEYLIKEVADMGHAVIVGRGANFVLKRRSNVINVLVHAPLEARIERLVHVEKLTPAEAAERIQARDAQYGEFIREYYNADWTDPSQYHLVINTANIPLSVATASISQFVKEVQHSGTTIDPEQVHRSYDRLAAQDSYTLKEAADLLLIGQDVLRQAIYRGELKGTLVGHMVTRIPREALVEWLHQVSQS